MPEITEKMLIQQLRELGTGMGHWALGMGNGALLFVTCYWLFVSCNQ
jgi:hypothetical protein